MSERIAILVIHGIGQQQPYETLDQFTRNLWISLNQQNPGWEVQPQMDRPTDPTGQDAAWTRVSYRLVPPSPGIRLVSEPDVQIEDITLFEYYWAPVTQDKITYTGSLSFLIKAGLQPFLYLASNLNALGAVDAKKRGFLVAGKEILRQAFLFLPLVALFGLLLVWLQGQTLSTVFTGVHLSTPLILAAIALAIRVLYIYTSAKAFKASLSATPGNWQGKPIWRACLALAVVLHLVVWPLLFTYLLRHSACQDMTSSVAIKTFFFLNPGLAKYWSAGVFLLLAMLMRFILVDYVGDVAVYVNSSQFSGTYKARAQILDQCSFTLADILSQKYVAGERAGQPVYNRVLIAAHSLGTVIAYDTMNVLLNTARTADPDPSKPPSFQPKDLDNLRGLLTFGSPLNKIFYFFREQDDPKLALRSQSLNLLRGFRLNPTLTHPIPHPPFLANPDPRWCYAENALTEGFKWINAYSLLDPISGRIVFYDVNEPQLLCNYKWPVLAHLEYWEDPNLYTFFRNNLL